MGKVLKFSYFFIAILISSCGENPKQKTVASPTTKNTEANVEVSSEGNKTILFFGNSLTAAYGLETEEGFPNRIQEKIDSLGLNYTVINSGLSGETTSGGLNRLDWVLNQKVDIFVLELGANDGLRGIPLTETRTNLQKMIDLVRAKNEHTQIVLAGMQIPPNMGEAYTTEFRNIFPNLAEKNAISLIPFLLEGVAGNPDLNLEDGIHPTAEGQKIVAQNVWEVLQEIIQPVEETEMVLD
ncbi:arylesterase [Maribacter sp. MJ134]|uniref:arylesterase n=1 Tax=Maribacter sp. MJ134 TaxID=2496865 RepID=UPI000F8235DC|nr:arylesterase [Maribacter sp. MJ134]AZQ58704.1 arylesterase [Maribacter sp. MJ134]